MLQLKNKRPTWCHLLFYFTSYVLNMFRTLIYPSSGACDCVVELPHRSSCSQFAVCWRFGVAGFEWCPCCRLKHKLCYRLPQSSLIRKILHFLGGFAKLRKATVSFVKPACLPVCLSVRPCVHPCVPMNHLGSHWTNFHEIWYEYFTKISPEYSIFTKIWQDQNALHMKTATHFLPHLAQFFLELEILQTKVGEQIKTHILCSITFFSRKSCSLWDNVKKNIVQLDRPRVTIRHTCSACWVTKATNAYSEYVIINPLTLWRLTTYIWVVPHR